MPKTILIVDDDPLYLELVKDVLKTDHHIVHVAENGATALAMVSSTQYDAIISDIEMPVMNGIQFHEQLVRDETGTHTPFIFLTASEDLKKLRYVLQHPETTLMHKSEVVENLLPLIHRLPALH